MKREVIAPRNTLGSPGGGGRWSIGVLWWGRKVGGSEYLGGAIYKLVRGPGALNRGRL